LEADGADDANKYFASSTARIYVVADGKYQVAFYDTTTTRPRTSLMLSVGLAKY